MALSLRNALVLAAAATVAAGTASAAGDRAEIGIELGAVAPDDGLRPGDGDAIATVFGFKAVLGAHDGFGWFGGLDYFAADAPALDDDPSAYVARVGPEWILGAAGSRARWFFDLGGGATLYELADDRTVRAVASAGLGQRIDVGTEHTVGWEVRANHDLDDGGAIDGRMVHVHALLSLNWGSSRPPADTDADGVLDRRDDCPGTPRGAAVDERGCPSDGDADGVLDGLDACPDTPAGWPVDARGCPLDTDGDGVPDGADACAGTPRGATVDGRGCPSDGDADGVLDGLDACPDTPAGAAVDAVGCPSDGDRDGVLDGLDACPGTAPGVLVDGTGCALDTDGDGVPDGIDRCPGTPPGTAVDRSGCPELGTETSRGAFVLRGVHFELDSATLTADSYATLDRVAETLAAYPEARIEIGGHTDTRGSAAYNLKLSEMRAIAVREYLAGKGIDPDRMVAKGYGETTPIDDGNSKEAHARNRRVELRKLN